MSRQEEGVREQTEEGVISPYGNITYPEMHSADSSEGKPKLSRQIEIETNEILPDSFMWRMMAVTICL